MKTPEFSSVFAASLRRFVAFRRVGGCVYANGARDLAIFDRFVSAQGQSQPLLSSALFAQYRASMPQVNAKTRYTRLCVVRHFSAFHHLEHPSSEVLHELGVRTADTVRFILLSESEVGELMRATPALRGRRWSPDTARCLIGLLYSCGLRISEALALRLSDFDPAQATLFVRHGKFGKQRCLPLSASTQAVFDRYLKDLRLPPRGAGGRSPMRPCIMPSATCWHTPVCARVGDRSACMICATVSPPPCCVAPCRPAAMFTPCCPGWPPTWGMS